MPRPPLINYHDTVRCPVCRTPARVHVEIVTSDTGAVRRVATLLCPSHCQVSPMHALRLADPMAC